MKLRVTEQTWIALLLIAFSVIIYSIQVSVFHDSRSTAFYLLQDLAFVPIQVLLISMLVNQILANREKKNLLNKLNMLIGVFFSEMGTRLVTLFSEFDCNQEELKPIFLVKGNWTPQHYRNAAQLLKDHRFSIDATLGDLQSLLIFMVDKRTVLTSILANPSILEHDSFSELVWAVLHLVEELEQRPGFDHLPTSDCAHLAKDIQRAYSLLILEWLAYMGHLQSDYPYLFSLAVRNNPFNPLAQIIVVDE